MGQSGNKQYHNKKLQGNFFFKKTLGYLKKLFFALFFLILFSPIKFTYSQNVNRKIPKLNHGDVEVISEAFNLWKTEGDKIWKGWTKIKMPFLYKKENFEYWINFPDNIHKGKYIQKIKNMSVYGKSVSGNNGFAASMDIDSVAAVVLSSPKITGMTKERWIITAIHEMFHVYQNSKKSYQRKIKELGISYGKDASWMLNYPFPYKDSSLQTISHMEGYLLYKIYKSNNNMENIYDSFLLSDILSLYKNHIICKYGTDNNYKYSEFQQSVEGIAKYTEIKMAKIAEKDYTPINPDIHFTDIYTNQINVIRHCGKGTGGRLTFYYLGLGTGLVLDKINPSWKENYFKTAWLNEIFNISLKQIIKKNSNSE